MIVLKFSIEKMEESESSRGPESSDGGHNKQMGKQLKKINEIQRSILDMQAHINFLLKRQASEGKKVDRLNQKFNMQIVMFMQFDNLLKGQQQNKIKNQYHNLRSSQIRSNREKQLNQLKQTKQQMIAYKEAQMRQIRQISKKNNEKIHKMKKEQKIKNQHKAHIVRRNHASRVEQNRLDRQIQKKQKQQEYIQRSMSRLKQRQIMQDKIQQLKIMEQIIKTRLKDKKQRQKKIKQTADIISNLNNSEVIEKTALYKNSFSQKKKQPNHKSQTLSRLEKQLFSQAINQSPKSQRGKENILFSSQ